MNGESYMVREKICGRNNGSPRLTSEESNITFIDFFFFFLEMDMHPLRMGNQPRLAPMHYRPVCLAICAVHFPDAAAVWLAAVETSEGGEANL